MATSTSPPSGNGSDGAPPAKRVKLDKKETSSNAMRLKRSRELKAKYSAKEKVVKYPTGSYMAPITPDVGTANDDFQFVKAIEERQPRELTTSRVLTAKAWEICNIKTKEDMIPAQIEAMKNPPPYEAVDVLTHEEMLNVLKTDYKLVRCSAAAAKEDKELANTHNYTIEKCIAHIGKGHGQAYMPQRSIENGASTHPLKFEDLQRVFGDDGPSDPADFGMNILDIKNVSQRDFHPTAIKDVDLLHRIEEIRRTGDWSRAADSMAPELDRWLIMTMPSSASPFHVDYCGFNTCVVGLEDGKIWHTLPGPWEEIIRRFYFGGCRETDYARGVEFTKLEKGVCLIQSPGTVHAVSSLKNCLVAGCFFLTAPTFWKTVRVIKLCKSGRLHTNDDPGVRQWRMLAYVFDNIFLPGLFTDVEKQDVWVETAELLEAEGIIEVDDEGEWDVIPDWSKKPAKDSKHGRELKKDSQGRYSQKDQVEHDRRLQDAENEFLWACKTFWVKYKRAGDATGGGGANPGNGRRAQSTRANASKGESEEQAVTEEAQDGMVEAQEDADEDEKASGASGDEGDSGSDEDYRPPGRDQ